MGVFSLLSLLGIALFLARKLDTPYSSGLLHSVAAIVLLMYLGGLVNLLWWATLALHLVGLILFGHEAWLRGKGNQQLSVSTPLVFLVIATLGFTMLHGRDLYHFYDEYAHWGIYIKEMLVHDSFWGADTNARHPGYVPAAPLWQYFFSAFVEFREGTTYVAHFVMLVVPMLVLFERIDWRNSPKTNVAWIVLIVALGLLGLSNFSRGINTIYVDHLIGAWFAGIVLCFAFDMPSPRKAALYLLPLTVLALIKPSSAAFSLAAGGIIAMLLAYRCMADGGKLKNAATVFAATLILVAVSSLSVLQLWQWRLHQIGVDDNREPVTEIVSGIAVDGERAWQREGTEVTPRFLEVFIGQQLSNDVISSQFNAFSYPIKNLFTEPWRLSTLGFLLAYFLWWIALLVFVVRGKQRPRWGLIAAGTGLTAVCYVGAVYMTYRFALGGAELSSYMRYVHTIALALLVFAFAPLLPAFRIGETDTSLKLAGHRLSLPALFAVLGCLALYVFETPYLRPALQSTIAVPLRQNLEPTVAAISEMAGRSRVWVYLPNDQPNGFIGRVIQYLIVPTPATIERDPDYLRQPDNALLTRWSEFDFVWIAVALEADAQERFNTFAGEAAGRQFFRVDSDNEGKVRLVAATDI